mgnify:CR=1 FL=1
MNSIKIKFPNNEDVELELGKPVVLLGANGAGKTRFGVKVEELNDGRFNTWGGSTEFLVHRISAQKSLSISERIVISDNESSKRELYYGNADSRASKHNYRHGNSPATHLLDDYSKALSLLFSEANKELHAANEKEKLAIKRGEARPDPAITVVDRATEIWNELLPHRKIDLSGNGVHVEYNAESYHGKEMSDGERVMLYMICQALVLQPNSLMIVDEPELHIHKAIVDKLWTRLEIERPDCVFMYITHDLDFALSRVSAKTLWIKSYNGTSWEYEFIDANDFSELPSNLLYEIIGTRQKILFVEGDRNSYDHQLYQEIYKDKGYHVIPCGGCHEVVRLVKSKNEYQQLGSIEVVGLIDRDFRTEHEIASLRDDGIYFLDVAEVENLFIVPEVLDIMEQQLGCNEGTAEVAKEFIVQLFSQIKESQINLALHQELYYRLSTFGLEKEKLTPEQIKEKIDEAFSKEKIEAFLLEKKRIFDAATNIKEILKVFNLKEMSQKVGPKFDLNKSSYREKVLNLVRRKDGNIRDEIISAIKTYTPELP